MTLINLNEISSKKFIESDSISYCIRENKEIVLRETSQKKSNRAGQRRLRTETYTQRNNKSFSDKEFVQTLNLQFVAEKNKRPEMRAADLCKIVGAPFNSHNEEHAFFIHDTNDYGEAVGKAYFSNSSGGPKEIAWYWHPENGFQVIATLQEFLNTKEIGEFYIPSKTMFQFTQFKINNDGVIAGSFDLQHGIQEIKHSWFWWSKYEGLHISPLTYDHLSVKDIDDKGNVLINIINKYSIISNTSDMSIFQRVDYPIEDIKKEISILIKNYLIQNHYPSDIQYKWDYSYFIINAESLIDGNITGKGSIFVHAYKKRKGGFFTPLHGIGILDIEFQINKNGSSFSLKERRNF